MRPARYRALLGGLVLFGVLVGRAEAQVTCAQLANATCRPVTLDATCFTQNGEVEESSASCPPQGGQTMVCCAPPVCEDRGGTCRLGMTACPAGEPSLGDGTCSNGGICCEPPPYTPQTCAEKGADICSLSLSCPPGATPKGAGIGCTMCCASGGSGPCIDNGVCSAEESCGCTDCSSASRCLSPPPASTYKVEYLHTDALGNVRMVTDQAGAVVSRRDYYPFGAGITPDKNGREYLDAKYAQNPTARQRFTGKERDPESGLDYFGARYYSSAQGRFTTPDAPFADQNPADPQSWNLYSYVRNNPLRFVDTDGSEASVVVKCQETHSCSVAVTASIAIYGTNGTSEKDLAAIKGTLKENIEAAWTGQFVQGDTTYTVTTTVDVSVVADERAGIKAGAQNVIEIDGSGKTQNHINPNLFNRGYDTGAFDKSNMLNARFNNIPAHEFGHIVGLDDNSGRVLSNTNPIDGGWAISAKASAQDYLWAFGPELAKGISSFRVGMYELGSVFRNRGNRKLW